MAQTFNAGSPFHMNWGKSFRYVNEVIPFHIVVGDGESLNGSAYNDDRKDCRILQVSLFNVEFEIMTLFLSVNVNITVDFELLNWYD
ncbi:hypothetical protein SUGI_0655030 [Cryptomeria japonica]|nr:hypothetical protein SUGI_0655030 [Cryptomeria japonica]